MKAFFYTLILGGVLVGAVALLMTLPSRDRAPEIASDTDAPSLTLPDERRSAPMIESEPIPLPQIGSDAIDEDNIAAMKQTGEEMLNLWHLPEATKVFERIVAQDSSDVDALIKLVECYAHPMIGREAAAAQCWHRARASELSSTADSLLVRAVGNLFVQSMPRVGVQRMRRVEEARGKSVTTGLYIAKGLLMTDQTETAESVLEELLDGDRSLGRVREMLVHTKIALGKYDEAETLARELAAVYPEEPFPYVLLSRVLLLNGKDRAAAEFGNNALLLDDRYIPAILTRAHLYVAQGELEAARVSFEKLLLFDDEMLSSVGMEGIGYVDFIAGRFGDGAEAMDEAIRLAMSAGSSRRGLLYAFRLVDYLCELGRADAALGVAQRWIANRGKIPERLGAVRIRTSTGEHELAREALNQMKDNSRTRAWMRMLAIDLPDAEALTLVQGRQYSQAIAVLEAANEPSRVGSRRPYLMGFATFETGDAEAAGRHFDRARLQLQTLDFPYHGDPILYVQSVFFQAETALARGEAELARDYYEEFLTLWGEAEWQLGAVDRARQKLTQLLPAPPEG